MTLDEIEQEVMHIKAEGCAKVVEDYKINGLLMSYFYEQKEMKMKQLIQRFVANLNYIMRKRNMHAKDLFAEFQRKTGMSHTLFKSNMLYTESYYCEENLLTTAMTVSFLLNLNPTDMLYHDMEYLSTKNMISTW